MPPGRPRRMFTQRGYKKNNNLRLLFRETNPSCSSWANSILAERTRPPFPGAAAGPGRKTRVRRRGSLGRSGDAFPPSMTRACPVMKDDPAEARKSTASAISSTLAKRNAKASQGRPTARSGIVDGKEGRYERLCERQDSASAACVGPLAKIEISETPIPAERPAPERRPIFHPMGQDRGHRKPVGWRKP